MEDEEDDEPVIQSETDDTTDETEASGREKDEQEPPDVSPETEPPSPEDVIKQAEEFCANAAETLKRVEKAVHPDDESDDLFKDLD